MYGYVLQIPTGLPETIWACKTLVDDYSWQNRNTDNMIEFSICNAKERFVQIGTNGLLHTEGTTLSSHIGTTEISSFAKTGIQVEISSIAVRFPKLSVSEREFSESDYQDKTVLLLPILFEKLPQKTISEIEYLFHRYIHSYAEQSASSEMMCRSIIFELLYRIDGLARRTFVTKKDKYTYYYVKKADSIISTRYTEKLTIQQIAKELGITPNYLSAIYKSSMGIGFSDRLYEMRIRKAEQLLMNENLSAAVIAERVGLGDKSNLRKRFKQYYGVSMREYRSIAKEQTLYHDKPMRKSKTQE